MKTLFIKDLSLTTELDGKAMAIVVGGTSQGYTMPSWPGAQMPHFDFAKSDINFNAAQMLSQSQNTVVNNGNNVAFSSGITANVDPHQTGKNTINFS